MTTYKNFTELEIEDENYLEKQRVLEAHRQKQILVNDINSVYNEDGKIKISITDKMGKQKNIIIDAYLFINRIDTDKIREELAKHILKGRTNSKKTDEATQNVIMNSTFSNTKNK